MPSKRRTTMKRIYALAFLTAALISMGSARAHAQEVTFKVPFDFIVENRVLPAGTYGVSHATQNAILIKTQDGRFHAMTLTFGDDKESYGVGKLIFTKYGNQYFLHEVLCSDVSMNVEIPKSRLEKQARIEEAQLPHIETVAALHSGVK
jgi:opacity protein-like surface antigen